VKISIYLPDELAARVREAKLPVSTVCQGALSQALRDLAAIGPHIDHEVELPADVEVDVPVVRNLAVAEPCAAATS